MLVERTQLFGETAQIVDFQQQSLDTDLPEMRLDNPSELLGTFRFRICVVRARLVGDAHVTTACRIIDQKFYCTGPTVEAYVFQGLIPEANLGR